MYSVIGNVNCVNAVSLGQELYAFHLIRSYTVLLHHRSVEVKLRAYFVLLDRCNKLPVEQCGNSVEVCEAVYRSCEPDPVHLCPHHLLREVGFYHVFLKELVYRSVVRSIGRVHHRFFIVE